MEPSSWQRIQALFEELLDLPPDARGSFLDERCVDSDGAVEVELRGTLEGMLDSAEIDDDFLVSPVERGDDREPPRILGDFELIEEVGRGGMGVVYRARQTSLDREVAVKVLPQWWFQSPRQVERFQRESRAGGRLAHPGIVTVYADGRVDDAYYFAMEYLAGPTLEQLIKARKSTEESPWSHQVERVGQYAGIAELMAGVADALEAAHSEGIVHRDVKPSNLIMATNGSLKLGDFGLVLDARSASMSHTGEVLGSPHYMSPEQASGGSSGRPDDDSDDADDDAHRNSNGVDHRTDIYSLGVILYELLAGERPFRGDNVVEVLRHVVDAVPRPVRSVQPKVPHDLAVICEVAMAKRPDDRYATAAELAADLRRALALEPIHARPLPRFRRALRWARRHRAPLWTAGASLVSASALGSLYLEQSLQVQIADQLAAVAREADALAPDSWSLEAVQRASHARSAVDVALAGLESSATTLNSRQQEQLESSKETLANKTKDMVLAGGELLTEGLSGRTTLEPWRTDSARMLRGATLVYEGNLLRQSLGLDTSDLVEFVQKEWLVTGPAADTVGIANQTGLPVVWLHEFDPLTGIPRKPSCMGPCPAEFTTSTGHFLLAIRTPGRPVIEFDRLVWATSDVMRITVPSPQRSGGWAPKMVKLIPEPVTYEAGGTKLIPLVGRKLIIAPFWIDQFEVSNAEYAEFVAIYPKKAPHFWSYSANVHDHLEPTERNFREDWGRLPVMGITPVDARAYAEWRGLRLPTLAEHMYAARGPHGRHVPWCENEDWDEAYLGNCSREIVATIEPDKRLTEYLRNVMRVDSVRQAATAEGVFHLLGNVNEITATFELALMENGNYRCLPVGRMTHGGTWYVGDKGQKADLTTVCAPIGGSLADVSHRVGFRCARSD